jgi:hypothetical protein
MPPSALSRISGRVKQLGTSTRSDVYQRPDIYDMEYAGAANHDAGFFARLLTRIRPRRVLVTVARRPRRRRSRRFGRKHIQIPPR